MQAVDSTGAPKARHKSGHTSAKGDTVRPKPASLNELIRLRRPVTIRELMGALPFLKYSTIANALARGEIPGTKVTARTWIISPGWLETLARHDTKTNDKNK